MTRASPLSSAAFADNKWLRAMKKDANGNAIMECVVHGLEHSMDILTTCDAISARRTQDAVDENILPCDLTRRDYAQLHDDCLESLLQQQRRIHENQKLQPYRESTALHLSSSSLSFVDFNLPGGDIIHNTSTCRRRAVRIHRKTTVKRSSPLRIRNIRVTPNLESDNSSLMSGKTEDSTIVSGSCDRELPDAVSYIHSKCRLQKDKGKGEPLGSDICATGQKECVEKLRQKMELLTRVAMTTQEKKKKGSASMKRRNAKVTEVTPTYTETRSVIDLKMGFLSMTYGVLLRWDTIFTGKAVLVVLRKMCHNSFYRKPLVKQTIRGTQMRDLTPILVTRDGGGKIVILQRIHGTEVTILEPPYRVFRPVDFNPSKLSISILRFDGFHAKSTWTMNVTFDNLVQTVQQKDGVFETGKLMEWEVPSHRTDFEFQVTMYEQKRPRSKRKRLVSKKTMYLNFLDAARISQNQQLEFPCLPHGKVIVNAVHNSDYANWLYKELEARREEEGHDSWLAPFYPVFVDDTISGKKDCDGLWELCCYGST